MRPAPPPLPRPPRLDEVPPAPRRPSRQARRLILAYTGSQAVSRIVGVVFLVVGLAGTALFGAAALSPESEADRYAVLLPAVFPIIGGSLLFGAIRSNRREVRAFVHGRPALARVTFRGQDRSAKVNGRYAWVIRWELRVPTGEVVPGALSTMEQEDLEPFWTADELVVVYDPADPRVNTLFVA